MVELIITEKPKSALKIANALANGKPVKKSEKGVPYYLLTHKDTDIIVVSAVGHLFGLGEKGKNKWTYPVFDVEWKPNSELSKGNDYSKKYLQVIKKLSKDADEFTVATDYDIEGEVIGLNIIRHVCKKKDANRMKFSTLTKDDLIKAYENKSKTLDWGQANAGETRHKMDWFWGINNSRALTASMKAAGTFKVMSTGRVQGPALKIIVDKEKEIQAFKPVPYWQIELQGNVKQGNITAWHKEDKFWEKSKADKVMAEVKSQKKGIVSQVTKSQFKQAPPHPFDLTSMQIEAYRVFKISPKETLAIAQELYTSGFISYPRTSSQQLPPEIGYAKILGLLKKDPKYEKLCKELLAGSLSPNNGKKTDPAHPALYPTGIIPSGLNSREHKIYDLIVKRFMATFSVPATRETMKIDIDVKKEIFLAKGTRTTDKGWHRFYEPYVKLEEEELPSVAKNDDVTVKKIEMHAKETQPPKRYTPASIIKELEKKNLGTKATRAQIIDTLFQRNYIKGTKSIEATELGIQTEGILEKFCPRIIDPELTRMFEHKMEDIREKKSKPEEVLDEAKNILTEILKDFGKKEKNIGEGLKEANIEERKKQETIGKCPNCKEGMLTIRKGKFGRFAACNKHPECKTTFSLPNTGMIKVTDKVCEKCNMPLLMMIMKGKRPQEVCINPKCPSKEIPKSEYEEKPCPKCKEGTLVLRKSVYGAFLGCSRYPKCKYTEQIQNGKK